MSDNNKKYITSYGEYESIEKFMLGFMKIFPTKMPKYSRGVPEWFHDLGRETKFRSFDAEQKILIISRETSFGEIAKLTIYPNPNNDTYFVKIEINFGMDDKTKTVISVLDHTLYSAFGFSDLSPEPAEELIKRYGCSAASVGQFVRYENYLNMPGPGTGNDCDTNISILIDDKMKEAVLKLIQ
ncbi:MAG: hypothetical protein WC872_00405 [Candidatus Absconditabacterales bacterium]